MSDKTHIQWTDATWNPVTGCSIVSAGCTNCYAMRLAGTRLKNIPSREGLTKEVNGNHVWTGEIRFNIQALDEPLRWAKPRMIFVCAHGDLFHEGVSDEVIDQVFAVIARSPRHTFQILTKRESRMHDYIRSIEELSLSNPELMKHRWAAAAGNLGPNHQAPVEVTWPLPNVWLGVSVEDQKSADQRISVLLNTPAAVRWISAEPLLGPIDLTKLPLHGRETYDALAQADQARYSHAESHRLDWVVLGGESGPEARLMHYKWEETIRLQCEAAGVPYFRKQWGEWKPISAMLEDEHVRLYRSNKRAAPHQDQAAIDESYGRTCTVDACIMHADGKRFDDPAAPMAFNSDGGFPMTMFKVGKKAAGSTLNGIEHQAWPEAAA